MIQLLQKMFIIIIFIASIVGIELLVKNDYISVSLISSAERKIFYTVVFVYIADHKDLLKIRQFLGNFLKDKSEKTDALK